MPTLRALLFPDERPVEFYRAYVLYDGTDIGFVPSGLVAQREGVRYSTRDRGNSNVDHLYGTLLGSASRWRCSSI